MDKQLWQSESAVLPDVEADSDVLLVAFAGNVGRFGGIPGFEFRKILSGVPAKKLFLRDPQGLWYLCGVPGIGDSVAELAQFIKETCDRQDAKRLITLGNSGGGYAAIVFGVLAGADEVHAFGPQTRLEGVADTRHPGKLARMREGEQVPSEFVDLRELLLREDVHHPSIRVYYSCCDRKDRRHGLHLGGLPNVELIPLPTARHSAIKRLKQLGVLEPLLATIVAGDPYDVQAEMLKRTSIFRECVRDRIIRTIAWTKRLLGLKPPRG